MWTTASDSGSPSFLDFLIIIQIFHCAIALGLGIASFRKWKQTLSLFLISAGIFALVNFCILLGLGTPFLLTLVLIAILQIAPLFLYFTLAGLACRPPAKPRTEPTPPSE